MRTFAILLVANLLVPATPALAWGYEGHRVVADIARSYLLPDVRRKVDALLATDTSTLTERDMASEATWADAFRNAGHRETAQWHFVDQEVDGSADLKGACFGFPSAAAPASQGPARDCVVDKIDEFAAELAAPDTPPAERLLALKFLLHFVGDVHQPLHASDNHDRGGNCVLVALGENRTVNLHSYWDTGVVEELGRDPAVVAERLRARITPSEVELWSRGNPATWAAEAFAAAKASAYTLGSAPGCRSDAAPIALSPSYQGAARSVAALQLEKAGVRLATLLNRSLASIDVASPVQSTAVGETSSPASPIPPTTSAAGGARSQESLACSAQADARGFHGAIRKRFRRTCLHASAD